MTNKLQDFFYPSLESTSSKKRKYESEQDADKDTEQSCATPKQLIDAISELSKSNAQLVETNAKMVELISTHEVKESQHKARIDELERNAKKNKLDQEVTERLNDEQSSQLEAMKTQLETTNDDLKSNIAYGKKKDSEHAVEVEQLQTQFYELTKTTKTEQNEIKQNLKQLLSMIDSGPKNELRDFCFKVCRDYYPQLGENIQKIRDFVIKLERRY